MKSSLLTLILAFLALEASARGEIYDPFGLFVPKDFAAISDLIAAASVAGEDVQMLRASASALGAIGPEASEAIPTLEALARMPRVQWAAEEALRTIRR